ncbi:hypothetical protein CC85DRAFT_155845 [Cutaneotrichosporon oleaginosum]|uniref:Sensor domain-containing protein n=1 Tax=Cutaneotrichosporon oleaginosum TaxID=879819 RepID=A0A0J1BBH0_9TREE|nr:uncharacterized protein CC85DRAFT_155845 [Cutaneotrichosporon oleaginosum]KLT45339.1 hypothetical protein CC85DRAFT_155845 [Cutaneotrichosporon oleaginosum]TXT14833.1 hypothetical protein COLE_01026 [Cutaneotrichosporon oleaginosum]
MAASSELVFPRLDPDIYPALASISSTAPPPPSPGEQADATPRPEQRRSHSSASLGLLSALPAHDLLPDHSHPCCRPPVFVLAADGSSVYRLDPKPAAEQPPPYAPIGHGGRARAATEPASSLAQQYALPESSSSPRPTRSQERQTSPLGQYGTFTLDPEAEEEEIPTAARVGSTLRTILCGDRGVALPSTDESAWRRYWAPLTDREHWRPLPHLLLLNFPFGLILWPPLLVGTAAGTALLLTLPLGAVVWWLTLLLARWAATLELRMQAVHAPMPRPRVVFYRLREPLSEQSTPLVERGAEAERDTRFLANSWAMFTDHYSYAALAYFLLIKPLVVVIPTILLIALFPVSLVLVPLLPIYLRAAAAYGRAQARTAAANL